MPSSPLIELVESTTARLPEKVIPSSHDATSVQGEADGGMHSRFRIQRSESIQECTFLRDKKSKEEI